MTKRMTLGESADQGIEPRPAREKQGCPMRFLARYQRDHYAGALMGLIGLSVVLQASRYDLGTAEMMGPGFFPMILGCLLVGVGVVIFLSAEVVEDGSGAQAIDVPEWRGWICIVAGVLSFVILAERLGLLAATFSCVLISALGDRSASLRQALVLAAGMSLFGVSLFSYGLRIPLPVVNW